MKIIKHLSIVALGIVFLLPSCSVEKRQHMSGYYIDWAHGKKKATVNENKQTENEKRALTKNTAVKPEMTNETTVASTETQAETQAVAVGSVSAKTKIANKVKSVMSTGKAESLSKGKQFKKPATIIRALAKSAKRDEPGKGLYIVLAIFIPFVAVGLATDWGIEVVWNILWCLLCGIPGIIHAFVILKRKGII